MCSYTRKRETARVCTRHETTETRVWNTNHSSFALIHATHEEQSVLFCNWQLRAGEPLIAERIFEASSNFQRWNISRTWERVTRLLQERLFSSVPPWMKGERGTKVLIIDGDCCPGLFGHSYVSSGLNGAREWNSLAFGSGFECSNVWEIVPKGGKRAWVAWMGSSRATGFQAVSDFPIYCLRAETGGDFENERVNTREHSRLGACFRLLEDD